LIKYDEPWGALNTNIREEIRVHTILAGTKRKNICGRHKSLNEILISVIFENSNFVGAS